jgi:hypothetical protein
LGVAVQGLGGRRLGGFQSKDVQTRKFSTD